MTDQSVRSERLIIPALSKIYCCGQVAAETLLRVVTGLALVVHGWPKIQNPFGAAEMVQGLGFYPGELWSLLLSGGEFFGGILLLIGLLTRPAAVVTTIILLVTVYSHGIAWGEGWAGAEKSILWAAITFFFVFRGGNRLSVDAKLSKEF